MARRSPTGRIRFVMASSYRLRPRGSVNGPTPSTRVPRPCGARLRYRSAMVTLAVNDTPLARSLSHRGLLDADLLETSGPHVDGAVAAFPQRPFLLHNAVWDWSLAHPDALSQDDVVALTMRRLAQTRAPWLSAHIGFSAATVAYEDGMRPTSPQLDRDETLASMVRTASDLAGRLEVPLLLENLDYQPTGAYAHICEPAFVRELIEASGTYLLLYLAELPLDRVRQLHVSGPRLRGGVLVDAHEPLRDADVRLLQEMLWATTPWALTLEYGRDEAELLRQVEVLRDVLGVAGTDR